jgi:hypothetical protein
MIAKHTDPYFTIICDGCGEGVGSEDYGGNIICGSQAEAELLARDWEWRVSDAGVTCAACLGEENDEPSSASAADAASKEETRGPRGDKTA